jgi:hypothetical protein
VHLTNLIFLIKSAPTADSRVSCVAISLIWDFVFFYFGAVRG